MVRRGHWTKEIYRHLLPTSFGHFIRLNGLLDVFICESLAVEAVLNKSFDFLVETNNIEVAAQPPEKTVLSGMGSHMGQLDCFVVKS